LKINISQSGVVTQLRCGALFNSVIAQFSRSVPMKELWKLVDIWRRYWQTLVGTFFWPTLYMHTTVH